MNSGIFHGVTSTITLAEILVQPIQRGRLDIARQYELALSRFGNFWMTAVDTQLAVRAAELRAQHGLHVADALQIASALEQGATAFLTNDARLRRVRELEVLMLEDFVEEPPHR